MHQVHFLTQIRVGSKEGWVAPAVLPSDAPQDGTLAIPVFADKSGQVRLFPRYQLEYLVRKSDGHCDAYHSLLDCQPDGTLKAVIEGTSVTFVKRATGGQPEVFDYIGKLTHADFQCPLCEIDALDENDLDNLYKRKHVVVAGCEPETQYGNFGTVLNGQKPFR